MSACAFFRLVFAPAGGALVQRLGERPVYLAGLLVASAMLLPYWRTLGTAGFIIAAVLALYIVLTIIVSDRRREGEKR